MSKKSLNMAKKAPEYITECIKVDKLIPGGQALGTLADGKKIFLWNALPGEIVTKAIVAKEKASFVEAIAVEIEQESKRRVSPKDECYLSTSPWQIFNYDYELSEKRELVREVFRQQNIEFGGVKTRGESESFALEIAETRTDGREYYYRNKMEYALYYSHEDQKIYPAFRTRGSHSKVAVRGSSLERPEIFAKAEEIVSGLNIRGEEARKYQSILLRANQAGEVSGGLLENHHPHPQFAQLKDKILGREYTYSPNGFFQINLPVYELALTEIAKWVQDENVLDLYAGVGTIGLSVARDKKLTLVECDKAAYREMERNCQGTGAHPVLAKSEEALGYIHSDQTVILDPPRAGCRPELIERLLEEQPNRVIYLSCNPATQARDVAMLLKHYRPLAVMPFNFFPRTPHIENLVVLERKNAA